ncbi:transposase, partial [Marinobacterium arenosum]
MADKYEIDIQAFAKALQAGQSLNGKDGLLTPLIKQITEAALGAELDEHLTNDASTNRKNGTSKKTVKTASGEFELETPRDRNGSF